jgi:hypothetical protein
VILNQYGKGESILLNWKANQRIVAVGSVIMQRSLQQMVSSGKHVYVLRSETNGAAYGYSNFEETMEWLGYLGWQPVETSEAEIGHLEAGAALVLPDVYLISSQTGIDLAGFVYRGGNVIFIDGPTKAIDLKEIQAITGMNSRGLYFKQNMLMTATDSHPLIPVSQRNTDLKGYQNWDTDWRKFRGQSINNLIREIYERVKAKHPDLTLSITITADQNEAGERYLQDWQTWLKDGYVDLLIPRGYVDSANELVPVFKTWEPAIRQYRPKIVFGLISYTEQGKSYVSKPPEQLQTEIKMALQAGSNGFMIFDQGHMSDNQLSTLKSSFPASTATP